MTYDIVTVWSTREDGPALVSHLNLAAHMVTTSIVAHSKQVNAVNCHIYIKAMFLDKY